MSIPNCVKILKRLKKTVKKLVLLIQLSCQYLDVRKISYIIRVTGKKTETLKIEKKTVKKLVLLIQLSCPYLDDRKISCMLRLFGKIGIPKTTGFLPIVLHYNLL
jgi:hypothetical protein